MQLSIGPSISNFRSTFPAKGPAVLIAMGQSNMVDQSDADATALWPDAVQIFDPATESLIAPAKELLWLPNVPGTTTDYDEGPGHGVRTFATLWCQDNPGRNLIVLPAARSGTGFKDEWYADGTGVLYNETIRLLDVLLAQVPGAEIIAALVQNGERDAGQENSCYAWNAIEMVAKMRDRYSSDIPFIWGEPGLFAGTQSSAFDLVRKQMRVLPDMLPDAACSRAQDADAYDAFTDIGDGLHFDRTSQEALGAFNHAALEKLSEPTTLPDVAHIWQSAGLPDWNDFDIAAYDVQAGDRLVFLAAAHRSSGNAYLTDLEVAGTAGTIHHQSVNEVTTRLALSVAEVVLDEIPETPLMPVACSWEKQPLGGTLAIWRLRGPQVDAVNASVGTGELTISASGSTLLGLLYGVDTAGTVFFETGGSDLVSGPGNVYATSFSSREYELSEAVQIITATPATTPSHGCGFLGVSLVV